MYEFTHKGAWLDWRALDVPSRWLAGGSMVAAIATLAPFSPTLAMVGAELHEVVHGVALVQAAPVMTAMSALIAIGFGILSAVLWWRFSLRQDELFNRVSNWALGMMAGWLVVALAIWTVLSQAKVLPPVSAVPTLVVGSVMYLIFWFAGVRRWGASG